MQVLFTSSTEAPSLSGLGIIPSPVTRFLDADKSVPHIGWNTAVPLDASRNADYYYFVHSFCAKYDPAAYPGAAEWADATTQYGKERFVSQVKQGNVFATQFHPEKSGQAGLDLLAQWLNSGGQDIAPTRANRQSSPNSSGLTRRVIACMDVRANDDGDLVVTKGDQYDVREKSTVEIGTAGKVRNLGKPVALASRYYEDGADEICLLNITSFRHSPLLDQPMLAVVRAAAACVFVPLTIGGGIKDTVDPDGTKRSALEVAGAYFRAGADKVSIGSEAVYAVEKLLASPSQTGDGTSAIETIASVYGSQAVVVSIDPRRVYVDRATYSGPFKNELVHGSLASEVGKSWWYQCTVSGGRESRLVSVCQLARGVETLGAGEILLNSIDRDGTGLGFDLGLIRLVKGCVKIPVVASSGAGSVDHFVDVFQETKVEAALAAGIFHRGEVSLPQVKERLQQTGVWTRR